MKVKNNPATKKALDKKIKGNTPLSEVYKDYKKNRKAYNKKARGY